MKMTIGLLCLATGLGCLGSSNYDPVENRPAPIVKRPVRPPDPVRPEKIDQTNAHDKADALWQELDRESMKVSLDDVE